MKVGDLVKYIPDEDYVIMRNGSDLFGIIVRIGTIDGYYTVAWVDGSYDEDLVHSEMELVNESR